MLNDVCIIIISKRPNILTLESYDVGRYPTYILSDADTYDIHREKYANVIKGGRGIGEQTVAAYELAYRMGFPFWVRLDDDLPEKTFVDKYGYPDLQHVILELYDCIIETKTSLAGLANSTNKSWMRDSFSRTYGLIHGGCNIAISARNGAEFTPPKLKRNGDVWRSCAHRRRDGAVGRVQFIGFDKGPSTLNETTIPDDEESIEEAKQMILAEFPDMVKCDGWREIGGKKFPNWRMLRGGYRKNP